MYTVGQQILDGKAAVVTVDSNNLILSISITEAHDVEGNPLTVTYSAGVTEEFIKNMLNS